MRFIEDLCWLQIRFLHRIHKESKKHHVRQRAQCILLSYSGSEVAELAEIFGKTERTSIHGRIYGKHVILQDYMTRKAEGESPSLMMISSVR